MCPVYIILHGNPPLRTPNPLIPSFIHRTFSQQFPGALGWVGECSTQLVPNTLTWEAQLCRLGEGAHIDLAQRHQGEGDSVLCQLPCPEIQSQTMAVCAENNKGVCRAGWGSHRNIKPQGNGGKRVLGPYSQRQDHEGPTL